MFFKNSFGASTKYINSDEFEFAQLDVSFAGVELYIPKTWNVINQIDVTFGGVDEKNKNQSAGVPTLTLMGDVSFSGVTIIYI